MPPESISKAAKHVIAQALSVRKTEELVYGMLHPVEKTKKTGEGPRPQRPRGGAHDAAVARRAG